MRSTLTTLLFSNLLFTSLSGCADIRHQLVSWFTPEYELQTSSQALEPTFEGKDADREQVPVQLTPMARGFDQPTDIQFVPGDSALMVVLEKEGAAHWADLSDGRTGRLLEVDVVTNSEQGLLGLTFHPQFSANGKLYLNYTVTSGGTDYSRVVEWVAGNSDLRKAEIGKERVILELEQPYPNHNAGQLAFGPDGYLYIGWGDGGWRGDRHDEAQNPLTMLGSMLRIDVDRTDGDQPYAVPMDNPFVDDENFLPETWAWGLRNPWRYSFDSQGRLFVADVGQDKWEEVNIVEAGGNYGWNVLEGYHCFSPSTGCERKPYAMPVYEYGHDEGNSITGGYVYEGDRIPELKGRYVFGDFVVGKLWAFAPPEASEAAPGQVRPVALGRWPILPSTFGQDARGEIYVADFIHGKVYRLDPMETTEAVEQDTPRTTEGG